MSTLCPDLCSTVRVIYNQRIRRQQQPLDWSSVSALAQIALLPYHMPQPLGQPTQKRSTNPSAAAVALLHVYTRCLYHSLESPRVIHSPPAVLPQGSLPPTAHPIRDPGLLHRRSSAVVRLTRMTRVEGDIAIHRDARSAARVVPVRRQQGRRRPHPQPLLPGGSPRTHTSQAERI